MTPYDRDDLMSYENALLMFNSRQQSKNTRYNIKKISSILGREFQIEIAKGFDGSLLVGLLWRLDL